MANLYWKSAGVTLFWYDVGNWWTDADATIQADNAPWCDGDSIYLDYNLTNATSPSDPPQIFTNPNTGNNVYGDGASGSCDIANITNLEGNVAGGTFTGSGFQSFSEYAAVTGGTFTGSNFQNYAYIGGGTFTGTGLVNGGTIAGGTFTGSGLSNSNIITGGTFSSGAITITQDSGNTLLAISGGPTYSYPTPASGGGGDATIARLLNLPWFVKI
jgi:hypothetical protein